MYIIYIYILVYTSCRGQEQGRKRRGKKVQSDGCKVAQQKRIRFRHFVFACMQGCQGKGCGMIKVHASQNVMIRCFERVSNIECQPISGPKNDTQKVAPHILLIHISPRPTSFGPLPLGLKCKWCIARYCTRWTTRKGQSSHSTWDRNACGKISID